MVKYIFIDLVAKEFGDKIHITLSPDSGTTGNLEITIQNDKNKKSTIVHSKKSGDGFVKDSNAEEFMGNVRKFVE